MQAQQINELGEYTTIKLLAAEKGIPYITLSKHIHRNNIPHLKLGAAVLVKRSDVAGYTPRKHNKTTNKIPLLFSSHRLLARVFVEP